MKDVAGSGGGAVAQPDCRRGDVAGGLSSDELVTCVAAATAAPSVHNSQPWRFQLRDSGVDVYADRRRQLHVIDPAGRELLISVGAAIFNLRLAMLSRCWVPATEVFPDRRDPDLVARVRPGRPAPPGADVSVLAAAIPRRHTNRLPFAPIVVPAAIIESLATAARFEGAYLRLAEAPARKVALGVLDAAERRLRARGIYPADATTQFRERRSPPAGIPPQAFGPWEELEAVPLRDFGLRQPALLGRPRPESPYPAIAILSTAADGPAQWVAAGQALQRTLLLATVHGLVATPSSQPLADPEFRQLMAEPGAGRWPQLILWLGYAPPGVPASRRPLSEVLVG